MQTNADQRCGVYAKVSSDVGCYYSVSAPLDWYYIEKSALSELHSRVRYHLIVSVTTVIILSQVLSYRKCYHRISSVILSQVLSYYLKCYLIASVIILSQVLSYRKCYHLILGVIASVIILS